MWCVSGVSVVRPPVTNSALRRKSSILTWHWISWQVGGTDSSPFSILKKFVNYSSPSFLHRARGCCHFMYQASHSHPKYLGSKFQTCEFTCDTSFLTAAIIRMRFLSTHGTHQTKSGASSKFLETAYSATSTGLL
jgi:hypothetical protein